MRGVILLIALLLFSASLRAQPQFGNYPVPMLYEGKRAVPNVKAARRDHPGYRAVLADAERPVNFAGLYVVSKDTCGTDSVRLMITNARTGEVFDRVPCFFWSYAFGPKARTDLPSGVEYRRNSSLLVAHGCFDADDPKCGDHYYKMTPRGLIELTWRAFKPALDN